jgi:cellulose synthase/poly-beta-1,6-N-acetylglucosamine synthase-like glycosyltransferase
LLAYAYIAYPLLAAGIAASRSAIRPNVGGILSAKSNLTADVILAALNEEATIEPRISELQDHVAAAPFGFIVGNDGSSDETAAVARRLVSNRVRFLNFAENRGRALVHNDCVAASNADILIFSDVETQFQPGFVDEVVAPFCDPLVGCVVGRLEWSNTDASDTASTMGIYWRYEQWIRSNESSAGLLSTGTGAAMAVRRELYIDLLSDEDVDFVTPIHVKASGHAVLVSNSAIAVDQTPATTKGVWRSRSRMTAKNLTGTIRQLVRARFPLGATFSLVSHKLLRWCTAYLMAATLISSAALAGTPFYRIALVGQLAGYAIAAVGGWANRSGRRAGPAGQLFAFLWNAVAMAAGVAKAVLGVRIASYEQSD